MQALVTRAWDSRAVWRLAFMLCALLLALSVIAGRAVAAPPPANAVIGNQASASYTDGSGNARSATSNLVSTTVQQVYSHTLVADVTRLVAPGATAYLPFTLTNTGNGDDSYALSQALQAGNTFAPGSITIYADANGDGSPDNFTPITNSGLIAAGQPFGFVVAVGVPAAAANNNTADIRVGAVGNAGDANNYAASGTAPAGAQQGVLGTVLVQTGAVVTVNKSYSITSGPASQSAITVTLTYTNSGGATANNLVLTDSIGTAGNTAGGAAYDTSQMTYNGNLSWSGGALVGPTQPAVNGTGAIAVTVPSVGPGQSGTVTFQVNVVNATPGAELTRNVASYTWTGAGTTLNTNQASYTVNVAGSAAVDVEQPGIFAALTPAGAAVTSAAQGGTVFFTVPVTNNGSAIDTFDLSMALGSFPAGTTFSFVNAGGVPLVDTNGGGIPDTGPVNPGATATIYVRAVLPPTYANPASITAVVTATSSNNGTVADTGNLTLGNGVTATSVDLTNIPAFGGVDVVASVGAYDVDEVTATAAVNPGQTASFFIRVTNENGVADNFNLSANNVPAGWTVIFRDQLGTTLTNTGNIAAGGALDLEVLVTTPASAAAGSADLDFLATSPAFGVSDRVRNTVTINSVATLTLTPNQSRQVFPGGSVDIPHQLCLAGNDGIPAGVAITPSNGLSWSTVLYVDSNGNGIADGGEPIYAPSALAANTCVALVLKVFAPSGATDGVANTVDLAASGTATTVGAVNANAQDVLNVVAGNLALVKEQSLTLVGGYTQGALPAQAPGTTIYYRVTVTNLGASAATSVVVSDVTPTYTTYVAASAATSVGVVTSEPAGGTSGNLVFTVGNLAAGASAVVSFAVQIDQ